MLRFEAEPTREPYGNDVFLAAIRALTLDRAAGIARAAAYYAGQGGRLLFDGRSPPCQCSFCTLAASGSQWTAEQLEGFEGAARDRIMAGVDMPGRIVDDVRPDQRGDG